MTENARKFLEESSKDKEFIEKLTKAETPEAVIALAAEKGFTLTEKDFEAPRAQNGGVSDEELDGVAGGKACVCVAGGGGTAGTDDYTCWCVIGGSGSGYYRHNCGYYGTSDGVENRCFCLAGGHGTSCD